MANGTDQKIRITVGLSNRMLDILTAESKRRGISLGDQVRRALDEWHETKNAPVRVLDRDVGTVRIAR